MSTSALPQPPIQSAVPTIRINETNNNEPNSSEDLKEAKIKGACQFVAFGCNITLVAGEDEMLLRFTKQKLVVNSIVCRDSSQLIWKIDNFSDESRKAKLRLVEPLRSETFYSEPFGYRMQAILAPYAYGDSLSFYAQLLPGDYDPILRWPFDAKILFTLYDQNPEVTRRLDYRYELIPNTDAINEAYVGRPMSDVSNGILGVESFVSLDKLYDGNYIVDDRIIVGGAKPAGKRGPWEAAVPPPAPPLQTSALPVAPNRTGPPSNQLDTNETVKTINIIIYTLFNGKITREWYAKLVLDPNFEVKRTNPTVARAPEKAVIPKDNGTIDMAPNKEPSVKQSQKGRKKPNN
ncbi:TNF receptor-associated factor 3 [Aphelenchoides besseyi]|nr:TNF receptor-associated factor 3 [Aphelenchoides besseyi]